MQAFAPCERNVSVIARPMPVRPPVMRRVWGFVVGLKKGGRGMVGVGEGKKLLIVFGDFVVVVISYVGVLASYLVPVASLVAVVWCS